MLWTRSQILKTWGQSLGLPISLELQGWSCVPKIQIELRDCKNMMQFLTASAENGWRVLGGSVSSKSVPLNDISPGGPTILVLGSEGTGLRPLVERSCTQLIEIPGNISSDVTAREANNVEEGMETNNSVEEFWSFLAV
ncbi:hypothetical protein NL676_038658 [Syzygium grande]|nr:hypothetical protein NL676_038658 [Syzygium grande]